MPWVKEYRGMHHYWTFEFQSHTPTFRNMGKLETIPKCFKTLCGRYIPIDYNGMVNFSSYPRVKDETTAKNNLIEMHKTNSDKPLKPCTKCWKEMKKKNLPNQEIV